MSFPEWRLYRLTIAALAAIGIAAIAVTTMYAFTLRGSQRPKQLPTLAYSDLRLGMLPAAANSSSATSNSDGSNSAHAQTARPQARANSGFNRNLDPQVLHVLESPFPATRLTPSLCLHLLYLTGRDGSIQVSEVQHHTVERAGLTALLLNEDVTRKYFKEPILIRTRYGVRLPTHASAVSARRADSSHRDQALAVFADLGIPLSQPLKCDGELLSVTDILRDSLANFHLRQQEIEWTAVAYAHYLSAYGSWQNRFAESFTFDSLANELLTRKMAGSSCGGLHILMALETLATADRERDLLTPETRERVRHRLETSVERFLANQQPEGCWSALSPVDADQPAPALPGVPEDLAGRLAISSHVLQFLASTRPASEQSIPRLQRGADWCTRQLKDLTTDSYLESFCPLTHAALAVADIQRLDFNSSRIVSLGH